MLWRERLDAVEDEERLDVHRLLGPERAIVIEGGDALVGVNEIQAAFLGHPRDELEDGRLRLPLVPSGQNVGGRRAGREHATEGGDSDDS